MAIPNNQNSQNTSKFKKKHARKLRKIVAISLASALAMSSLSAALVTASAASENQISTSGSLSFDLGTATGLDWSGRDGVYQLNLIKKTGAYSSGTDDVALPTWDAIKAEVEYVDEDGRTVTGEDMAEASLTYSVSSGSSVKLNNNKTGCYAVQNKKGATTIKATIKGKVTLNSEGKTKAVTASKNIVVTVREADERTLEVVDFTSGEVDNDKSLKDLAAIGDEGRVAVVEWAAGTGANSNKAVASALDLSVTPTNSVTVEKSAVVAEVEKQVQATRGRTPDYTAYKAAISSTINAISGTTLTVDNKMGRSGAPTFALQTTTTADVNGWTLTPKTYSSVPQYTDTTFTAKYGANANTKLAEAQAPFIEQGATDLTANKLVETTLSSEKVYIVKSDEDLSSLKFTVTETEQKLELTDLFEEKTGTFKVGQTDLTVTSGAVNGQERGVKVYKAKDASTALAVKTANYSDQNAFDTDLAAVVTAEAGKIKKLNTTYYVGTASTGTTWAAPTWTNQTSVEKFFTLPTSTSSVIQASGTQISDDAANTWAGQKYDAAIDKLAGEKAATGKIEYAVSNKSLIGDAAEDSEGFAATGKFETKGTVGSATITATVTEKDASSPTGWGRPVTYKMNITTAKAIDVSGATASTVTIQKQSSGKVWANDGAITTAGAAKNISGYEVRNGSKAITVESGSIGDIVGGAGAVTVEGGSTGSISVTGAVTVNGGKVGAINTSGTVTLTGGTVAAIADAGTATVHGGTVTGNVIANAISLDAKSGDDGGAIAIGGNVIAKAPFAALGGRASNSVATVEIDSTEDAKSTVTIGGSVISKFADEDQFDATLDAGKGAVTLGSEDTKAKIAIGGNVQGDLLYLSGKGNVSFAALKNSGEALYNVDEKLSAKLVLDNFGGSVGSVAGFDSVSVKGGTANIAAAATLEDLEVANDATAVFGGGLTVGEISGDGILEIPAGKLTVDGAIEGSPTLQSTGNISVGTTLYVAGRGKETAFNTPGLELKASNNPNGGYNYVVSKAELQGLYASAANKAFDIAVGSSQKVEVAINPVGTALPQGCTIKWEAPEGAFATVAGSGTSATITANKWSDIEGDSDNTVEITATIVDKDGNDAGYDSVTFTANITDKVVPPVILDTTSKSMQVGETYNFLVRDNKDAANIQLTYDANIVDVKLAKADYNGRGVLYTVTAKANGSTDVNVTYGGQTAVMKVKVGGFQLDTSAKTMGVGETYSFLAKGVAPDKAAEVKLDYDTTIAKVELARGDYNGRGALYTVTALKAGETTVKANYNGEEASMKLTVAERTGKLTLDTASYVMPAGGVYTIGVKMEKGGRVLSGTEVNALLKGGELIIRDSRTGSIIRPLEVLANGNVRVTGKNNPGTTYVIFEVVQGGKVAAHASVGVTVQPGAKAGGVSRKSVCQW